MSQKKITFPFLVICFGGLVAHAEEFKYRTIDENHLIDWQIRTAASTNQDKAKKPEVSVEQSFKDLKIEKKTSELTEAIKKDAKLARPQVIAILGDTGCRLKESGTRSSYQDCSDPKEWRYKEVIKSLAKEKPDLIVHVGDYHYREQCSSGKPCQKMSPEVGYGWTPWKLDFFEPSKEAFSVAPWIMVRGNHEDCQRAYLGYKTLLRTSEWRSECDEVEASQVIVLGDLAIVNLDSSAVEEMPSNKVEVEAEWKKRMEAIAEKLNATKVQHIWLITHKPVYGLVRLGKAYAPVNINLRRYFESSSWAKKVQVIIAGHVHNSQIVRVKDNPLQIVLGNGGTALDDWKESITAENLSSIGYEQAKIVYHDFGYGLVKQASSENPVLEFHDATGAKVFSCHLKNQGKDCF